MRLTPIILFINCNSCISPCLTFSLSLSTYCLLTYNVFTYMLCLLYIFYLPMLECNTLGQDVFLGSVIHPKSYKNWINGWVSYHGNCRVCLRKRRLCADRSASPQDPILKVTQDFVNPLGWGPVRLKLWSILRKLLWSCLILLPGRPWEVSKS